MTRPPLSMINVDTDLNMGNKKIHDARGIEIVPLANDADLAQIQNNNFVLMSDGNLVFKKGTPNLTNGASVVILDTSNALAVPGAANVPVGEFLNPASSGQISVNADGDTRSKFMRTTPGTTPSTVESPQKGGYDFVTALERVTVGATEYTGINSVKFLGLAASMQADTTLIDKGVLGVKLGMKVSGGPSESLIVNNSSPIQWLDITGSGVTSVTEDNGKISFVIEGGGGAGISALEEDLSPTLGGNLDVFKGFTDIRASKPLSTSGTIPSSTTFNDEAGSVDFTSTPNILTTLDYLMLTINGDTTYYMIDTVTDAKNIVCNTSIPEITSDATVTYSIVRPIRYKITNSCPITALMDVQIDNLKYPLVATATGSGSGTGSGTTSFLKGMEFNATSGVSIIVNPILDPEDYPVISFGIKYPLEATANIDYTGIESAAFSVTDIDDNVLSGFYAKGVNTTQGCGFYSEQSKYGFHASANSVGFRADDGDYGFHTEGNTVGLYTENNSYGLFADSLNVFHACFAKKSNASLSEEDMTTAMVGAFVFVESGILLKINPNSWVKFTVEGGYTDEDILD